MRQITLVVRDEPGQVARITGLLAAANVNLEDILVEVTGQVGLITLVAAPYDRALAALNEAGYAPLTEDVLVLRVKDEPGALAKVSRRFSDAGLNLRSVRIIRREQDYGYVAVACDRMAEARDLVKDFQLL